MGVLAAAAPVISAVSGAVSLGTTAYAIATGGRDELDTTPEPGVDAATRSRRQSQFEYGLANYLSMVNRVHPRFAAERKARLADHFRGAVARRQPRHEVDPAERTKYRKL